jgi:hypothetical protein
MQWSSDCRMCWPLWAAVAPNDNSRRARAGHVIITARPMHGPEKAKYDTTSDHQLVTRDSSPFAFTIAILSVNAQCVNSYHIGQTRSCYYNVITGLAISTTNGHRRTLPSSGRPPNHLERPAALPWLPDESRCIHFGAVKPLPIFLAHAGASIVSMVFRTLSVKS